MSTFYDDLQHLLALLEIDNQLDKAKATLAALDTGASIAATYNAGKVTAEKLKTSALKAQAGQHDAEMRLETIETKSKQVNAKLYGGKVTSPRELEDMQRELEMLKRQKGDAEEAVLVAMETASEAASKSEQAEAALTSLADRYRVVRAKYKDQQAVLTTEIAGWETQRTAAAALVAATLLTRYEGIRTKKGSAGAAPILPDGNCAACHTKLSTGQIEEASAARSAVLCEHCGRILIPT
jgi:predicted  nucleic acid-binding Zn-ribbon protein